LANLPETHFQEYFFQFVKLLTGDTSIKIGDDLESETCDIQVVHFRDPDSGRKVTIVDTPGFDDSHPILSNTDILKKISHFLVEVCVYISYFNPLLLVLMATYKIWPGTKAERTSIPPTDVRP